MFGVINENGWQPGIGDPTVGGWLTVAGYFLTAFLCWRSSQAAASQGTKKQMRIFWLLYAVGMVALGFNKQLDLQSWFTYAGKNIAIAGGWYEGRRKVQALFLIFVAVCGLGGLAWLSWTIRGFWRLNFLALAGGLFLLCFIVIRAASFHHIDQLLGLGFAGLKVNWILEWLGIGLIFAAAWRNSIARPPSQEPVPA